MDKAAVYIHGKGGNPEESRHYEKLFPECDVIGFDYRSQTPWEAEAEFSGYIGELKNKYSGITVIANSIGAYFTMLALKDEEIDRAYFISPVVDMEKLIKTMMEWAGVTEEELEKKKEIETAFGETLSWDYLMYARNNPVKWNKPTFILYGEKDNLTDMAAITGFAAESGAKLDVMLDGEHWFHTDEQMKYLSNWILKNK